MAIKISLIDGFGITHTDCYVKISEVYQNYYGVPSINIMCDFYHTEQARIDSFQPVKTQEFTLENFEQTMDISESTDIRNACYAWLMSEVTELSEGVSC